MTQERLEGIKRFFANPDLKIKTSSQQAMVVGMALELVKEAEKVTNFQYQHQDVMPKTVQQVLDALSALDEQMIGPGAMVGKLVKGWKK